MRVCLVVVTGILVVLCSSCSSRVSTEQYELRQVAGAPDAEAIMDHLRVLGLDSVRLQCYFPSESLVEFTTKTYFEGQEQGEDILVLARKIFSEGWREMTVYSRVEDEKVNFTLGREGGTTFLGSMPLLRVSSTRVVAEKQLHEYATPIFAFYSNESKETPFQHCIDEIIENNDRVFVVYARICEDTELGETVVYGSGPCD